MSQGKWLNGLVPATGTLLIVLAASAGPLRADLGMAESINCGSNGRVLIWKEGTNGTCENTSGTIYECIESGGDYVRADCSQPSPCEVVTSENFAGCYWTGDAHLPAVYIYQTLETISCSNGNTFDLTGVTGDTCQQTTTGHEDGTTSVTGGECAHKDAQGNKIVSTSTDCNTCGPSLVPADCKKR